MPKELPHHPDFYVQREHMHHEPVHYYIEHRTSRGRKLIQIYCRQDEWDPWLPRGEVDFWGRGARQKVEKVLRELVALADEEPKPDPLPEDESILEIGIWCHAEGMYDSSGNTDHQYGYPCEGHPQDHVPVAVVQLPVVKQLRKENG